MKKKNKAKKSITAVGAVVAAGLTPGIVTGSPVPPSPSANVELTAADAVSINGEVFDFDELLALNPNHQINRDETLVVVYGSRPPEVKQNDMDKKKDKQKDKKKDKKKSKKEREQEIADSLALEQAKEEQLARERYEAMRRDSIRAIQESRKLVYGPPPPRFQYVGPERLRSIAANDKREAFNLVMEKLINYCFQMTTSDGRDATITPSSNIVSELKLNSSQLKELSEEIENSFAVQLTVDMMEQLGKLSRIADFIVEVVTPIKN